MERVRTACAVLAALGCLAPGGAALAADLLGSVEEAYASRQLRRTPFDPEVVPKLAADEARFLVAFFALTDEAVRLNTDTGRWFASGGERGLHAADYLERVETLRARIDALQVPERVESLRRLVAQSLALQQGFIDEWHRALEDGRPFASQLTHEYAWHDGLARSQKLLLRAYVELRALFPGAGETAHAAFHDHLRAVNLQ